MQEEIEWVAIAAATNKLAINAKPAGMKDMILRAWVFFVADASRGSSKPLLFILVCAGGKPNLRDQTRVSLTAIKRRSAHAL